MRLELLVDRDGLGLRGGLPAAGGSLSLLLSGRPIWSFRTPMPKDDEDVTDVRISWPPALGRLLTGRALLGISQGSEVLVGESEYRFDDEDVELVDVLVDATTGSPLVVNKWGRLARSFAGAGSEFIDDVLDAAQELVRLVEEETGLQLFVTGGTLLGPTRDGRIMPNDDDADLAYLSTFGNPSDVALESYRLERALIAAGREVVRLSAGHLQIMFPGGTVQDRFYIDIFSYFVVGGLFYGTFHACAPYEDVRLLPLSTIVIKGRSLPSPASPRDLLAAIYGPTWEIPDPAFTFVTPAPVLSRYRGWLSDYNEHREFWEDQHRDLIARWDAESGNVSPEAREAAILLDESLPVLELGSGLGADARFLSHRGFDVTAVDWSRPAIAHGRHVPQNGESSPAYLRLNMSNQREVMALARFLAAKHQPIQLYMRGFLETLNPLAVSVVLPFVKRVLTTPGSQALFFMNDGGPDPEDGASHDRLTSAVLRTALTSAGLRWVTPDESAKAPRRLQSIRIGGER